MKTKLTIWTLIVLIAVVLILCFHKPSIHEATQQELQEINGIGTVRSELIVSYLSFNKDATIEELALVDGIDCITVNKLKKRYGD